MTLASRASVTVDELVDELFVTGRKGHWQRRLLDRLFAEKGLAPKVVSKATRPSRSMS